MLDTYRSLCTEFYDLDKPAPPKEELDLWRSHVADATGVSLEAMCGSGRFILPLRQEGYEVEGVDASPAMLNACRTKAKHLDLYVKLYEQNLEKLELSQHYSLIFIPSSSLILLSRPDARKALERCFVHLDPGGKIAFEVETPQEPQPPLGVWNIKELLRPDGSKLLLHTISSYDATNRIFSTNARYESVRAGKIEKTEEETYHLHLYLQGEIPALLKKVGFKNITEKKAANSILFYEATKPD